MIASTVDEKRDQGTIMIVREFSSCLTARVVNSDDHQNSIICQKLLARYSNIHGVWQLDTFPAWCDEFQTGQCLSRSYGQPRVIVLKIQRSIMAFPKLLHWSLLLNIATIKWESDTHSQAASTTLITSPEVFTSIHLLSILSATSSRDRSHLSWCEISRQNLAMLHSRSCN